MRNELGAFVVERKSSLRTPRFCRQCGGSLKRSGASDYRCTACGTLRSAPEPAQAFALPRPSQLATVRRGALSAPVAMRGPDPWAGIRAGLAHLADAGVIGIPRRVEGMAHSLPHTSRSVAEGARQRLRLAPRMVAVVSHRLHGFIRRMRTTAIRAQPPHLARVAERWVGTRQALLRAGLVLLVLAISIGAGALVPLLGGLSGR
jgi:hypothetical protein